VLDLGTGIFDMTVSWATLKRELGSDPFIIGTDFPHPDHALDVEQQVQRLVDRLPLASADAVLRGNIQRLYKA
jgi:predicted TIM-barrel fold metal-dependent hydrolase